MKKRGIKSKQIFNLYMSGKSIPELARQFKVAENTINYHLRKVRNETNSR